MRLIHFSLTVGLLIGGFLSVTPARAGLVDIDFSLQSGTLTGEIEGLQDNATSTPSEIVIFTQPSGYTYGPEALLANGYQFYGADDTFTLSSGTITGANAAVYKLIGGSGDFQAYGFDVTLDGYNNANGIFQSVGGVVTDSYNTSGVAGYAYTPVPEPRETGILLLLAAAGVLAVRKWRETGLHPSPA